MTDNHPPELTLAPTEWQVMKVLWEHGPMAARDVFAALPEETDWAYKTVKTLLSRLVAKGALDYDQIGNSYLYRPIIAQDEMTRSEVRTVFERIASKAIPPILANFIEEADLTKEDIAELKKILNKKQATSTRKKKPS